MAENTKFSAIYNRFLSKITDDMYMELTPEDTIKDLQNLLIEAIPGFEFPRKPLYDYTIQTKVIPEDEVSDGDFIIGVIWHELKDNTDPNELLVPDVLIECSEFNCELTSEEINILALLMKQGWVQRQVTSIENTRMKYSGSDFKFTSQANHIDKLLEMKESYLKEGFHLQRLYKRRKADDNGIMRSTFGSIMDAPERPKKTNVSNDNILDRFDTNKNDIIDRSEVAMEIEMTEF